MIAGEIFMQPAEGDLRLIIGNVYPALSDVPRRGLMVQEYAPKTDEDGFELVSCEWETVCPLTDASFMLPTGTAPTAWMEASRKLRDAMERGQPITLDMERASLAAAGGVTAPRATEQKGGA